MQERFHRDMDGKGRVYLPKETIDNMLGWEDMWYPSIHQSINGLDFLTVCSTKTYGDMQRFLIKSADEKGKDPAKYLRWLCEMEFACRGLDDKGYYVRIPDEPVRYLIDMKKGRITKTENLFSLMQLPDGGPVVVIAECNKLFIVKEQDETLYDKVKKDVLRTN